MGCSFKNDGCSPVCELHCFECSEPCFILIFFQILASLENLIRSLPKVHRSISLPILNRSYLQSDECDYIYSCASPKTPINSQYGVAFPFFQNTGVTYWMMYLVLCVGMNVCMCTCVCVCVCVCVHVHVYTCYSLAAFFAISVFQGLWWYY